MSLTATLTLLAFELRTAATAGCSSAVFFFEIAMCIGSIR
jgi:hypothetical protein